MLALVLAVPVGYALTSLVMWPYAVVITSKMGILGCSFFNDTTSCETADKAECHRAVTVVGHAVMASDVEDTQLASTHRVGTLLGATMASYDEDTQLASMQRIDTLLDGNLSETVEPITTELGSGVVQGVTIAQKTWAGKHNLTVYESSKSCNLQPGLGWTKRQRKRFKLSEWFHEDTAACCQKCRTTEECAYFMSNPGSTGHCYLLKIQAYLQKPTKMNGWSAGSVITFNAPNGAPPGGAAPFAEVCLCPEKCALNMKFWLFATSLGGALLAIGATVLCLKDLLVGPCPTGSLWGCFTAEILAEVPLLLPKLLLGGALLGWIVLGTAYVRESECHRLCEQTQLWHEMNRYIIVVWVIGLLTFLALVALVVAGPAILAAVTADGESLFFNTVLLAPPTDAHIKYKPVGPGPPLTSAKIYPGFIPEKPTTHQHCSLDYCPWEVNERQSGAPPMPAAHTSTAQPPSRQPPPLVPPPPFDANHRQIPRGTPGHSTLEGTARSRRQLAR